MNTEYVKEGDIMLTAFRGNVKDVVLYYKLPVFPFFLSYIKRGSE
jgi:hypothetical protein